MGMDYVASVPDSSTAMLRRRVDYVVLSYAHASSRLLDTTCRLFDDLISIAKSDHPNVPLWPVYWLREPQYKIRTKEDEHAGLSIWRGFIALRLFCLVSAFV
ncbi:hypothetical protein F5Y18DRAFT_402796 [Xylariaceae sp. FL1019]|nr:hypothetical protein F5Y18DRAFT_402796 [Xylariaceae sp. FL1019]